MAQLKLNRKPDSGVYADCQFCGTTVKRRGLRNHQLSAFCQAHQVAIQATSDGLERLPADALMLFRKYKFKVYELQTGINDQSPISGRTRIRKEYWGSKSVLDTYEVCKRVKRIELQKVDNNMTRWIVDSMQSAANTGEMPRDVKVADSKLRLGGGSD